MDRAAGTCRTTSAPRSCSRCWSARRSVRAARRDGAARGRRPARRDARRSARRYGAVQPARRVPRRARAVVRHGAAGGVLAAADGRLGGRAAGASRRPRPSTSTGRSSGRVVDTAVRGTPQDDAQRAAAAWAVGRPRPTPRWRRAAVDPSARPEELDLDGVRPGHGGAARVTHPAGAREAQRVPARARRAPGRLPRHRDGDPAARAARRRHGRAGRGASASRGRARGRASSRAGGEALVERAARAWAASRGQAGRPARASRSTSASRSPPGSAAAAPTRPRRSSPSTSSTGRTFHAETLLGIAAAVGSDVPALLLGGPVYAERPRRAGHLRARADHALGVVPASFAVRTPDAYALVGRARQHRPRRRAR